MISEFVEVRADGRVILENMTPMDIFALSPKREKVIRLEWNYDGQSVYRDCPLGVIAMVLPDRQTVALLEEFPSESRLYFVGGNGEERFWMDNIICVNGKKISGKYSWFEGSEKDRPSVLRVVFQVPGTSSAYNVLIESLTGEVISAWWAKH